MNKIIIKLKDTSIDVKEQYPDCKYIEEDTYIIHTKDTLSRVVWQLGLNDSNSEYGFCDRYEGLM